MCSAGVDCTGTFITIDHVLEQIEKERFVDIPAVIQNLRQQRTTMVPTLVCAGTPCVSKLHTTYVYVPLIFAFSLMESLFSFHRTTMVSYMMLF